MRPSASVRIHMGIDGLTTPAIGPALPWSWQGDSSIAPEAASASAASGVSAQPS